MRAESDEVEIEVKVLDGPPVELLCGRPRPLAGSRWADRLGGGRGGWGADRAAGGQLHRPAVPGGSVHLGWTPRQRHARTATASLFLDGRSRDLPWVTVQTSARSEWRLTFTPRLVDADPTPPPRPGLLAGRRRPAALGHGQRSGHVGRPGVRTGSPRRAVVHPRRADPLPVAARLEQYSGGAWGTRDVSQGPVGLLLTLGAHAELRSPRPVDHAGTERPRRLAAGLRLPRATPALTGQSGSHGDVVYWPLLALGQYLAATGDGTILAEQRSFTGDDAPTAPASVARPRPRRARPHRQHLDRADRAARVRTRRLERLAAARRSRPGRAARLDLDGGAPGPCARHPRRRPGTAAPRELAAAGGAHRRGRGWPTCAGCCWSTGCSRVTDSWCADNGPSTSSGRRTLDPSAGSTDRSHVQPPADDPRDRRRSAHPRRGRTPPRLDPRSTYSARTERGCSTGRSAIAAVR